MSDAISERPSMSPEEQESLKRAAQIQNQKLVIQLKILGMQMEGMDNKEKAKYSGQMGGLSKTLGKLRRVLRQNMTDTSWKWTIYVSLTLLILIYDRKREEKLKAKQSKKKK